jgi:transposase-like protein
MAGGYSFSTEGPQCPYCGRQYTADDQYYYEMYTREQCDGCGKTFKVDVEISTSWTCRTIEDEAAQ